jgi:uncharacterized protein (TIRG00374 family)
MPSELEPPAPAHRWSTGRVALLTVTGVCLYLLAPSLTEVFEAWNRLDEFHPLWVLAIIAAEALSFACIWVLQAITLHSNDWFDIITSHLAGNAFNRVTPGGGATGTALQARMLADAGIELGYAASALAVWSALSTLTVLAMPLFTIPAVIGGTSIPGKLEAAAAIGAIVFIVLMAFGAIFLAARRPILVFARWIERILRFVRPHRALPAGFAERLLGQRDRLRARLGSLWLEAVAAAVGRWAFDYLALLLALYALNAHPSASLVLLSFVAASVLGLLPFTPGGLGFVEAGLTGMLAVSGITTSSAVLAALIYRLISFWLPLPVGAYAGWLFRRRHPRVDAARL